MAEKIFKIRHRATGLYSNGVISNYSRLKSDYYDDTSPNVNWNKKGKNWPTAALVKKHLMQILEVGCGIPPEWEILEFTQEPSKEVHDWIDQEMMVKLLKRK
ncbi:MAG TPA: hypothetical protein VFM18_17875 [Methanosarcina sp.]|nr:hypothetical protein [Methanosarcina sp.]